MKIPLILFAFLLWPTSLSMASDDDTLEIYKVLFQGRDKAVFPIPQKQNSENLIPNPEYKSFLKKKFPGIQDETIDNYRKAILEPAPLTSKSNLGLKLIFVDEKTLKEIFSSQEHPDAGWERFRKRFSCKRLSIVSQVAFNATHDQALVFRDESYGSLGAEGITYFFIKKDGKWIIKDVFIESMS